MRKTALLLQTLLLLIMGSCADEKFAPRRQNEDQTTNPIVPNNSTSCSSFTLVKPQVDFLFLWDNSTSSVFINSATKEALNNTIDLVSSRFDYHIMLAPLVLSGSSNVNHEAKIITDTPVGLSSSALAMKVDRSSAASQLDSFTAAVGSYEEGVKRSVDVIKANISNGVFRPNSHLIVVVMSNQDDSSWQVGFPVAEADRVNFTNDYSRQLLCLRGNYTPTSGVCTGANLNSLQLRFMNITAFSSSSSSCGGLSFWQQGRTYQDVSRKVYLAPYTNGVAQNDQNTRTDGMYDSYDICSTSNFAHIFDGINASINSTLLSHKYNYWPVATSGASAIDPDEIFVYKDGTPIPKLTAPVPAGSNGFTFTNTVQTRNTRFSPSAGEPFTGYMIELFGTAQVTYPECIRVQTQNPKEYFGYIQLQSKPHEPSISVSINGVAIPKSSTNGWELIKSGSSPQYLPSQNIKIQGPSSFCPSGSTNYCPGYPAQNKSGYFLKLSGSAIYSNGASISVSYDPGA